MSSHPLLIEIDQDYPPLHSPSRTRCRLCNRRKFEPGLTVVVRYRQGWTFSYRVCRECYEAVQQGTWRLEAVRSFGEGS